VVEKIIVVKNQVNIAELLFLVGNSNLLTPNFRVSLIFQVIKARLFLVESTIFQDFNSQVPISIPISL
jgi:hypothetical protein